jgi:hypothetical protein
LISGRVRLATGGMARSAVDVAAWLMSLRVSRKRHRRRCAAEAHGGYHGGRDGFQPTWPIEVSLGTDVFNSSSSSSGPKVVKAMTKLSSLPTSGPAPRIGILRSTFQISLHENDRQAKSLSSWIGGCTLSHAVLRSAYAAGGREVTHGGTKRARPAGATA